MEQRQRRREIEDRPEIVVGLADLERDVPGRFEQPDGTSRVRTPGSRDPERAGRVALRGPAGRARPTRLVDGLVGNGLRLAERAEEHQGLGQGTQRLGTKEGRTGRRDARRASMLG